jgi:hypothetical protein
MAPKLETPDDLPHLIGKALGKAIKDRELTVVEAAAQLRISRQSLHAYLGGHACPSVEILYRACLLWNIVVSYGGYNFGVRSKSKRKQAHQTLKQRSISLPFTFEEVRKRDVEIELGKKTPRSVQLRLFLNVGS